MPCKCHVNFFLIIFNKIKNYDDVWLTHNKNKKIRGRLCWKWFSNCSERKPVVPTIPISTYFRKLFFARSIFCAADRLTLIFFCTIPREVYFVQQKDFKQIFFLHDLACELYFVYGSRKTSHNIFFSRFRPWGIILLFWAEDRLHTNIFLNFFTRHHVP